MGHDVNRLQDLGQTAAVQLVEQQGHQYGQEHVEHNKHCVVTYGVSGNSPGVGAGKEELEVLQANPVTAQDTLGNIVLFKGKNQAEHGPVGKQRHCNNGGQSHYVQRKIVLAGSSSPPFAHGNRSAGGNRLGLLRVI